ncbi:hypothetical protein GCM10027347_58400 [Larkinella harenae]
MNKKEIIKEIQQEYSNHGYTLYHAHRYATLIELIGRFSKDDSKILDIGRSQFTTILQKRLGKFIDTLGFDAEGEYSTGFHYFFNLNDCQFSEKCRTDLPKYDIIIMAEVIEHLYVSPLLVLNFLKSILTKDGILIVQTPNAVAIHKRIKMMFGRNPFEQIRKEYTNPGHFREYTVAELREIGNALGLSTKMLTTGNYFDYQYRPVHGEHPVKPQPKLGYLNTFFNLLPSSLKPGITIVFQNQ